MSVSILILTFFISVSTFLLDRMESNLFKCNFLISPSSSYLKYSWSLRRLRSLNFFSLCFLLLYLTYNWSILVLRATNAGNYKFNILYNRLNMLLSLSNFTAVFYYFKTIEESILYIDSKISRIYSLLLISA